MMMHRVILALSPAVLLAACGDDASRKEDGRTAAGEVLEGSISDAMIPLDQLKSQAPLAGPDKTAASAGADAADGEAGAEDGATPATDAATDPVAAAVEANSEQ
ncbi:MAG: hypothetical protein PHE36_08200 [Novosphingobium sp.]|nr:hypothetical protein [Novosphingobium sp.]